jgi:UDP-N-acetylglucosamine 2-epimerase (non-hydrolysing)
MIDCYDLLKDIRPDRVLILGDTNSALSSLVAKRLGIPVFDMEAGNRCFDERVSLAQTHEVPILVSTHPRTRARLQALNLQGDAQVRFLDPLGFFDFVALEKQAACVLSDSGTVQEECAILRVPSVTLRDVTERPETIECGANILTGCDAGAIRAAVDVALGESPQCLPPAEYLTDALSETVLRIVTGYCHALPPGIAGNN